MDFALIPLGLAGVAVGFGLPKLKARLDLSRAKHWSLAGHVRIAKAVARLVPPYEYDGDRFFRTDGAPSQVAEQRQAGFERLARVYASRYAKTSGLAAAVEEGVSDLQFTAAHRVPFQYSRFVRRHLGAGAFVVRSSGVTLEDLDGNRFYDLTGSYGVNLFGYDFYKRCLTAALDRVKDLGPVLGPYHPLIADNVRRLQELSGKDEVSFHMSGTEAVMQAVRLARYHTGRSHLVRFCGAYHGWWDEVVPGVGSPRLARETYTLEDMAERSLHVIRKRRDIACVLVNPLQALHPNEGAPSDATLVSSARRAGFDREGYARWLSRLRNACDEGGAVLVFDEVFVGFRLAQGGAQEYFRVTADLVTYGKTLGGGLPVGVLCGRSGLMKRFREERPADVCFARGTFNSHPYVMAAMDEFLSHLQTPEVRDLYAGLDALWDGRAQRLNARLRQEGLPVEMRNLSSIWTVCYTRPSRYNWMLQYYLRAEGLALSWIGTGRLIFSLDYTDADFDAVADRFVAAARAMHDDGWWWAEPTLTNRAIERQVFRELLGRSWQRRSRARSGTVLAGD